MGGTFLFSSIFSYGGEGARSKALALVLALGAVPAWAEPITIAALGDSLTQGYGLPQGQGLVPQLQGWLDGQGAEVTVLNAGVSGDTTAGGLARVAWTLTDDVDAMIVTLGGNDLLRGIDPAAARANLAGILQEARARDVDVLLVGMDAPPNYGAEYEQAFEAIYPDLAQEYSALLFPNFFQGLLDQGATPADAGGYMQPDGIHPNAEGVALIVKAIGPSVLELAQKAAP